MTPPVGCITVDVRWEFQCDCNLQLVHCVPLCESVDFSSTIKNIERTSHAYSGSLFSMNLMQTIDVCYFNVLSELFIANPFCFCISSNTYL